MHRRIHHFGVAAIVLALVTMVGVAYAQTATTSSPTSWTSSAVTGTVTSVDPQAKTVTIKTDAGASQSYLLSDPIPMRSAGKDISIAELKVGDRVRIDPRPGAGTDEPTQTVSRLEVLSNYGTESPAMGSSSPQRTVSTERPVLGERADAGDSAMPSGTAATTGSTTGRTVSTDRPVLGQKPNRDTASTGSTASTTGSTGTAGSTYGSTGTTGTTGTPSTTGTYGSSTYGSTGSSTTTTPSPSTSTRVAPTGTSRAASSTSTSADQLPATASPLPFLGILGLLALAAGFAVRATRKQLS